MERQATSLVPTPSRTHSSPAPACRYLGRCTRVPHEPPRSYVLLLAAISHCGMDRAVQASGCHAENHASRQRPRIPLETRRPAIRALGPRTGAVLEDRQLPPRRAAGPWWTSAKWISSIPPASLCWRTCTPQGVELVAVTPLIWAILTRGLPRAGLWYGGKSRLDRLDAIHPHLSAGPHPCAIRDAARSSRIDRRPPPALHSLHRPQPPAQAPGAI